MPGMDGVQLISELAQLRLNHACHHDRLLAPHHEQRQPHGQGKGLAVIGAHQAADPGTCSGLAQHLRLDRHPASEPVTGHEQDALFDRKTLERALRTGQIQAWFQPRRP